MEFCTKTAIVEVLPVPAPAKTLIDALVSHTIEPCSSVRFIFSVSTFRMPYK